MLPFWPGSVVVNDYATRKKQQLGHAVEYGLIFHGTRTVKYYCKNMKYRINIYIISREISIEHPSVGLASLAQSREISIEHPSVGLASLAQLYLVNVHSTRIIVELPRERDIHIAFIKVSY